MKQRGLARNDLEAFLCKIQMRMHFVPFNVQPNSFQTWINFHFSHARAATTVITVAAVAQRDWWFLTIHMCVRVCVS